MQRQKLKRNNLRGLGKTVIQIERQIAYDSEKTIEGISSTTASQEYIKRQMNKTGNIFRERSTSLKQDRQNEYMTRSVKLIPDNQNIKLVRRISQKVKLSNQRQQLNKHTNFYYHDNLQTQSNSNSLFPPEQISKSDFKKKSNNQRQIYQHEEYRRIKMENKIKDHKIQKNQYSRFSDPIDFSIMNRHIRFVQINSLRLYFQFFPKGDKEESNHYQPIETVKSLSQQYQSIKKRKLILHGSNIKIPQQMPIHLFVDTQNSIKVLEATLKLLNQEGFIPHLPYDRAQLSRLWDQFLTRYYKDKTNRMHTLSAPNNIIEVTITKRQTFLAIRYIKVNKQTRISDIIQQLKLEDNYNYDIGNIYVDQNRRIDDKQYNSKIFQIKGMKNKLKIQLISTKCMISANSIIKVKNQNTKKYQNYTLMDLKNKFSKLASTITYKEQQKTFSHQYINKIGQAILVSFYYQIFLKGPEQISIQCSQQTFFFCNHRWTGISQLKKGALLLGILPNYGQSKTKGNDKNLIAYYKVISVKRKESLKPKYFYPVSVANTHNLVVNNLIVHNRNPINLTIMQITSDDEQKLHYSVYKNEKIDSILQGQDYHVYFYGNLLKNNLRFADYNLHLRQQPSLQLVINKYQSYRRRTDFFTIIKIFITQLFGLSKIQDEDIKILQYQLSKRYMIILQNRVNLLNLSHTARIYQQNQQLLLIPKILLQRIQFLSRMRQYSQYRSDLMRKLQSIENQSNFQAMIRQTNNDVNRLSIDHKKIINAFTALQVNHGQSGIRYSHQINSLLREDQSNALDNPKKDLLFCMAGMLIQGLSCISNQQIQLKCYRGVQTAMDITLQKNIGGIILLEGFVSTSKDKFMANVYAGDQGTKLQIIITSGKQISQYSRSKSQKQVLLLPYSYFIIEKSQSQEFIRLREIPLPTSNKKNIIFFVDNTINLNEFVSRLPEKMEVVRVTTIKVMKIIIQKFLWIYKLLKKTIMIISNMQLLQNNTMNDKAGAELFDYMFNDAEISDQALIFSRHQTPQQLQRKLQNILPSPSSKIVGSEAQLVTRVIQYTKDN